MKCTMAACKYTCMTVVVLILYSLLQIGFVPTDENRVPLRAERCAGVDAPFDDDIGCARSLELGQRRTLLSRDSGASATSMTRDERGEELDGGGRQGLAINSGLNLLRRKSIPRGVLAGTFYESDRWYRNKPWEEERSSVSTASEESDPQTSRDVLSSYRSQSGRTQFTDHEPELPRRAPSSRVRWGLGFQNLRNYVQSKANSPRGERDGVAQKGVKSDVNATRENVRFIATDADTGPPRIVRFGDSRRNYSSVFYSERADGSRFIERLADDVPRQGKTWRREETDVNGQRDDVMRDVRWVVQDGVFWSEAVEGLLPVVESNLKEWRRDVRTRKVLWLLPGCGSEKNRRAVLDNGVTLCCRYRQNVDQIQGDTLSFHLSRLIGVDGNLPYSLLMKVDRKGDRWGAVTDNLTQAGWMDGRVVVATKWMPDLIPAYMPVSLRTKANIIRSETFGESRPNPNLTRDSLSELAQWSDLIVFDYLTANLDRILNTLVNLQWNKFMMSHPVHNLEMSRSDRRLLFLDNESGLLHGYRMLAQYGHYHDRMLESMCVFRRRTVDRLRSLAAGDVWSSLNTLLKSEEPLNQNLPTFPLKNRDILKERLTVVLRHIDECRVKSERK